MRPAGGGAGASWSLALTDGTTKVMTASSAEVADVWVSNLKVLLGEGGGGGGGEGKYSYNGGDGGAKVNADARAAGESRGQRYRSFGGTAPVSPVSPQRVPNSSAFGTARALF